MKVDCCGHCKAKRPNLHFFEEHSRGVKLKVVRCLLCGWLDSEVVADKGRWSVPGHQLPKDVDESEAWDFVEVPEFVFERFGYTNPDMGADLWKR